MKLAMNFPILDKIVNLTKGSKKIVACADSVTIFLPANKQKKHYKYILSLKPKRIVFTKGTENPELEFLAQLFNIDVIKGTVSTIHKMN